MLYHPNCMTIAMLFENKGILRKQKIITNLLHFSVQFGKGERGGGVFFSLNWLFGLYYGASMVPVSGQKVCGVETYFSVQLWLWTKSLSSIAKPYSIHNNASKSRYRQFCHPKSFYRRDLGSQLKSINHLTLPKLNNNNLPHLELFRNNIFLLLKM